ncbi:MAG: MFS transporter [Propionibacteriaceae bacterium]|uniref:MFS transporter n=1 Tax=Dietzia sp. UBA5065 TaxID=1946422 RepID=UPI0025C0FC32|nr:MFS transporter [Dietzia sp. UBA5065]
MSTTSTAAAWRAVIGFGFVSLAADMVYEGARSVSGPLLASLGASAVLVGLITGAGEAMALVLRVVFGPLADRTGAYWSLTIIGYGLTAVCVPLLAITPAVGAAGLGFACVLLLAERTGKAIRSPSKSALLAEMARQVGRGRGFGVHKAMDEVGAFAGPLLVAALIGATGLIAPAMAWLAIPGALCMLLLFWLRAKTPTDLGSKAPTSSGRGWWAETFGTHLGRPFFLFAACSALTTAGLVTFGVISFHLDAAHLIPLAAIPVAYAAGQATSGLVALVNGYAYDRVGARVLFVLPVLVAVVPALAFTRTAWIAVAGVLCWGAASGLQDSTVKALVADLVEPDRRATAYGVFAAIQGGAAILGGAAAGFLYETSLPTLIALVAATQVAAAVLLWLTIRRHGTGSGTAS